MKTIFGEIKRETASAVLISSPVTTDSEFPEFVTFWAPKSQITAYPNSSVDVQDWLIAEKESELGCSFTEFVEKETINVGGYNCEVTVDGEEITFWVSTEDDSDIQDKILEITGNDLTITAADGEITIDETGELIGKIISNNTYF